MRYKGINLENVKISNRAAILSVLNNNGAMSRKDMAQLVGLTPASLTLICNELLEEKILIEEGEVEEEKRAGRRKRLVNINYEYKKVLCVTIEALTTHLTVCNLAGKVLIEKVLDTDTSLAPEAFLKKIAAESKNMMWEIALAKEDILGIGVSVPGHVDRERGLSKMAYRIWDEPVEVGAILEAEIGVPVTVENNVKAFAKGELIYGTGKEQNNILFVKWGPGVGSAAIIANRLYEGKNGDAGELGHYIVSKNGKKCRCGKCGCLETYVSTQALLEKIKQCRQEKSMPQLEQWLKEDDAAGKELLGRDITKWGALKDEGLWEIFDESIECLAHAVANSVSLICPDKIIVYGYLFDIPDFVEHFKAAYATYDPQMEADYILKSELNEKISYIGSLAVIMDKFYSGE